MYHHAGRCCQFILTLTLTFFLICGTFGCSKSSDPDKTGSQPQTAESEQGKTNDLEKVKQIYLAFIGKFQLDSSNPEKADLLSSNQGVVSETISELEGLQGEIEEPKAQEIYDKLLDLLRKYNEAAPDLERKREETKSAMEDLDRREAEAKAKMENERERWNGISEKLDVTQERSKLADWSNVGAAVQAVQSIEAELYWIHNRDFGMQGLK